RSRQEMRGRKPVVERASAVLTSLGRRRPMIAGSAEFYERIASVLAYIQPKIVSWQNEAVFSLKSLQQQWILPGNSGFSMLSAEPLAGECRALAERSELGPRDSSSHRRHGAIGAAGGALLRHVLQRLLDGRRHFVRRLDRIAGDVDDADLHVLAFEQREKLE